MLKTSLTPIMMLVIIFSVSACSKSSGSVGSADEQSPAGDGDMMQIVEYYNQNANLVKSTDNIEITKHDVRKVSADLPSALKALAPSGDGVTPDKDETITETFVNGIGTKVSTQTIADFLPIAGKPYLSKLDASFVRSASRAEQDGGCAVTIHLKEEPLDMSELQGADYESIIAKGGYASCMDIGLGESQGGAAGGNALLGGSVNGSYKNGVIVAVFDSDNQLTSLSSMSSP